MASPEVYGGSGLVYVADVGTAFPAINAAPAVGWTLIGTGGDLNYTEAGITIRRSLDSVDFRALGSNLPIKTIITSVGAELEFEVMDTHAEETVLALGGDITSIVDTAAATGIAGNVMVPLPMASTPLSKAILLRIPFGSPINPLWASQWEFKSATQVGTAEATINKTAPFAMRHIWRLNAETGVSNPVAYRYQDAVAL